MSAPTSPGLPLQLLAAVCRFVRGEPLRNVVDKDKWY
jgi:hypothetical protein